MKRSEPEPDREDRTVAARRGETEPDGPSRTERGSVVSLHRAAGNRAVQRLHESGDLQAKLEVSRSDDEAEREAERVADEVARMPDCETVIEPDEGVEINRRGMSERGGRVDSETEREIESIRGGGRPLSPSTRSFFEPRFGRDLSDVRVHTGAKADEAAESIDAEAFTLGSDIVYGDGKFRPGSSRGRELIAHELAHVVQQADASRPAQVHRQAATMSGGQSRQPSTAGHSDRSAIYVVQPGDTLWDIAEREYGDGRLWPVIYRANQDTIDDPDRIYPGQELTIPPRSEAEAVEGSGSSEERAAMATSSDGETMTFSKEDAVAVSSESETRTSTNEEETTTLSEAKTKEASTTSTGERSGWFDSSLQWVWGVLKGDFEEDPSVSQIVVRTILTLIPYVDQVADVQDLTAAVYKLAWQERTDEFGPWFDLFLTAVGFIPELGSLIKGIVKLVRKSDEGAALLKRLSSLTDDVPKLLNRVIDTLEDNRQFVGEKAAQLLESFARQADSVASKLEKVPWWVPRSDKMTELASELRRVAGKCRELAKEAPKKMEEVIDEVIDELKDARRQIEGDEIDQNKLHHLFGRGGHNLEDVVSEFGSREEAFRAIKRSLQEKIDSEGISGVFEEVVEVGSHRITVRGKVIDGEARIGTAFKP